MKNNFVVFRLPSKCSSTSFGTFSHFLGKNCFFVDVCVCACVCVCISWWTARVVPMKPGQRASYRRATHSIGILSKQLCSVSGSFCIVKVWLAKIQLRPLLIWCARVIGAQGEVPGNLQRRNQYRMKEEESTR